MRTLLTLAPLALIGCKERLNEEDSQMAFGVLNTVTRDVGLQAYGTLEDAAKVIDINPEPDKERQKPQSSYGAVLNYSLFASTDNLMDGNVKPFQGISGGFDARFFSPYGTLSQSFTARYNWPVPADDRPAARRPP